jgi:hypothetical protein
MNSSKQIDLSALDVLMCMNLNGKQLKVMLVMCIEAMYPAGVFYLSDKGSLAIMEMTKMKSKAQRNVVLSQLKSMGYIKALSKGSFMINPEFYYEGTPEEHQSAVNQFMSL